MMPETKREITDEWGQTAQDATRANLLTAMDEAYVAVLDSREAAVREGALSPEEDKSVIDLIDALALARHTLNPNYPKPRPYMSDNPDATLSSPEP